MKEIKDGTNGQHTLYNTLPHTPSFIQFGVGGPISYHQEQLLPGSNWVCVGGCPTICDFSLSEQWVLPLTTDPPHPPSLCAKLDLPMDGADVAEDDGNIEQ